jgi:hypothetical protein
LSYIIRMLLLFLFSALPASLRENCSLFLQ